MKIAGSARHRYIRALATSICLLAFMLVGGPTFAGFRQHAPPERVALGGFSSSLFTFKTINKDDPTDAAGGWQEADVTLNFRDGRQSSPVPWTCTLKIGMPLRTVVKGKISAERAAEMSATVATEASSKVMHAKSVWVPAEFCNAWRQKMRDIFADEPYKGIGPSIKA